MGAPERLDRFMARANAAYYAQRDPFADFTTAPEIAQMFGEILGAWAAICWRAMGAPEPVLLVEAGPGRGTLMADARRGLARAAPDFLAAARLHLVETSPRLRAIQAECLPDAIWHDAVQAVPAGPMLLLANEFLDALPIRQFVRRPEGWCERHVADGSFVEFPCEGPHDADALENVVVEQGQAAGDWCDHVARRIAAQGGAALLLDYGPARSAPGDSLQALRDGRPADPLSAPGSADVTAHVDFASLGRVARAAGAAVHGPIGQGALLTRLGLFQRSRRLAGSLPPGRALALMDAAQRLSQPERMGALFKAIAICHPASPVPPGFE